MLHFFVLSVKWRVFFNMGTFFDSFILNISWVFFFHVSEGGFSFYCCQDWTRSWETCSLNSGSETVGGRLFGVFFQVVPREISRPDGGISIPKFWEKWNPIWLAHIFFRWVGEQPPTRGTIVTMVCFQPWIWLIWFYSPLITGSISSPWPVFGPILGDL